MRKKWLAAAIAAVVIAVGTVGGVVMAQDGGDSDTDRGANHEAGSDSDPMGLWDRVAETLNVTPEALRAAIDQAEQDIRAEQTEGFLNELVENEVITQAAADQYLAWLADRPEGLPDALRGRDSGRGFGREHRGFGRGHGGFKKFGFSGDHDFGEGKWFSGDKSCWMEFDEMDEDSDDAHEADEDSEETHETEDTDA